MARFLARLAAFGVIQLAIGAWLWAGSRASVEQGYLAAVKDKVALLCEPGPPRVIFTGGSSVAFGIDGKLIGDGLDRAPVNLGCHGALGLDFYLRLVEAHARPGDLVVLLPEYPLLGNRMEMEPAQLRTLLRQYPGAVRYMAGNAKGLKVYLDHVALSELAWSTQEGIAARWEGTFSVAPPGPAAGGPTTVYRRASFNRYGDMVGHHHLPPKPLNNREGSFTIAPEPQFREAIDRLNRFHAHCRAHEIRVVFSYPPVPDFLYDRSRDALNELHEKLASSLDFPIVNHPRDTVLPEERFYDSIGHLGQEGRRLRSRILLRGLRAAQATSVAAPTPRTTTLR
jgi:hypothetical protein